MSNFYFFITLGLISVAINIILTIIIVSRLQERGVKIDWLFMRMLYPKYVHQYKVLIKEETGKVPSIFYSWLVTINGALVFCIIGLILR